MAIIGHEHRWSDVFLNNRQLTPDTVSLHHLPGSDLGVVWRQTGRCILSGYTATQVSPDFSQVLRGSKGAAQKEIGKKARIIDITLGRRSPQTRSE